jgi:protein-S-isoprenylcysteine O-methyltransferase Ste14
MSSDAVRDRPAEKVDKWRVVRFVVALPVFFALFMFLPAGTWTWAKGWLFIVVFLAIVATATLYLSRVNPEVIAARSRSHEGTKPWDKVLLAFFFLAVYAIVPVAALDDGRFHWFPLPWWVCGLGYALLVAGMAIVTRAEGENKFFELTVRIQSDRGQTVIDTGPYAIVRHPGYAAAAILFPGTALCLGSLWALIPAGMAAALLILRAQWEDQMLQAELAGYKEYAQRVRHKLIPRVW